MLLRKASLPQWLSVVVAVALWGASTVVHGQPGFAIVLPVLAAALIAGGFFWALRERAEDGLLGDLGAIYTAFLLAYTIVPAFTFLILELDLASGWAWSTLTQLLPDDSELGVHLWRHVLYIFGFCASYLYLRKPVGHLVPPSGGPPWDGSGLILPFVAVLVICNLLLGLLSAPVEEYIDHYTRYDHLSSSLRALVSLILRVESGLFLVVLTIVFMNFRRYGALGLLLTVGALLFKVLNSMGSRIESLFVLLAAVCLYQHYVHRISVGKAVAGALAAGALFTALEVLREVGFDLGSAVDLLVAQGVQPAAEFGAVFLTSFHLYTERASGTLPPTEWPMFFSDFVSLVMPNSFVRYSPQYWYADYYFPMAVVPPQTNGPIADSAVWGGEADLLIRSVLNGLLFAWLTNYFHGRKRDWRVACVYVFCFSTSIMTIKYSIFYHLNPIVKTVLPAIIGVSILRRLVPRRRGAAASPLAAR